MQVLGFPKYSVEVKMLRFARMFHLNKYFTKDILKIYDLLNINAIKHFPMKSHYFNLIITVIIKNFDNESNK